MEYKKLYEDILQEHRRVYESLNEKDLYRFIDTVKKYDRIFLIGVGREGMATRAFAMRLMHMGKEIHWIWDDTTPSINKGDLLIATLGDCEIGHIRYICQKAKENVGYIYMITGSKSGSAVKELADDVLFVPASVYRGRDKVVESIQPMGNLFEQTLFIVLDIVVMMIVDSCDLTFGDMSKRHRNVE